MERLWTRETLSDAVRTMLDGRKLIIVSNREPFQHKRVRGKLECTRPAGGMAAALDPVMRASGGLWIAHGSGDADRLAVDAFDHVQVPPEAPSYTLRRVWLSREEEDGYYGGLSNQALWPLCHVAFTRPLFDPAHWAMYRHVNRKFARAVLEEAGDAPTLVFIQDYHFGLLPRMLRESGANLAIAHFWHIPWPNAEVFSLFPWREELLDGMLANDVLGFHLPHHCQNFLKSIDQTFEAKVDRTNGSVCRSGHLTSVREFPIGIDFEEHAEKAASQEIQPRLAQWRSRLKLGGKYLGIGIDRLDYTKGIPERLRILDCFLEKCPEYRGKLVFAQVAVPSRSSVPAYRQLELEVDQLTAAINRRWRKAGWEPLILLKEHHGSQDMIALHRLAQFCLVTSLHDGMNLVSKEFLASRTDEEGVLILSEFAGAAHELKEALLINPFSVEQGAAAIQAALRMPIQEQRRRMRKLRAAVEHNNVYRWAGRLLKKLSDVEFPNVNAPAVHTTPWTLPSLEVAV